MNLQLALVKPSRSDSVVIGSWNSKRHKGVCATNIGGRVGGEADGVLVSNGRMSNEGIRYPQTAREFCENYDLCAMLDFDWKT